MNVVLIVLGVWLVLGAAALVVAMALGRAAKSGDELLWRSRLSQMRNAHDRRAAQRRGFERRSSDLSRQLSWTGSADRRRGERRRLERRSPRTWRDLI